MTRRNGLDRISLGRLRRLMPRIPGDPRARRVEVLGIEVDAVTIGEVPGCVAAWLQGGERQYVCVTGVHGVIEAQRSGDLVEIHNGSGLTVPDGAPIAWAARWAGADEAEIVYGPEMMLEVCARSVSEGWRHFFYGGGAGTAELLAERLTERFPGLVVAGTLTPPFRELTAAEDAEVIAQINASRAEIIWVGLSTPKQERWMAAHVGQLRRPAALFGVGAAFDVHAGLKRDAPVWMGRLGLRWAFRFAQEPRRLWRRYLINNPAFLVAIARHPPRLLGPGKPPD